MSDTKQARVVELDEQDRPWRVSQRPTGQELTRCVSRAKAEDLVRQLADNGIRAWIDWVSDDVAIPPAESMTARLYALADRWSPTTDMTSSRVRARFECAEDVRLALAGRCRDECSEQHTYEPGVCEAATPPPPSGVSEQDDRHTSAGDLGLCHGVDSCVHGRSVWSCPLCDAGQLAELVSLWGRDTAAAASCRRSVRMVWPELGERLDDLLDQQDGGDR